jgi:hypothetical protein
MRGASNRVCTPLVGSKALSSRQRGKVRSRRSKAFTPIGSASNLHRLTPARSQRRPCPSAPLAAPCAKKCLSNVARAERSPIPLSARGAGQPFRPRIPSVNRASREIGMDGRTDRQTDRPTDRQTEDWTGRSRISRAQGRRPQPWCMRCARVASIGSLDAALVWSWLLPATPDAQQPSYPPFAASGHRTAPVLFVRCLPAPLRRIPLPLFFVSLPFSSLHRTPCIASHRPSSILLFASTFALAAS